MHICSIPNDVKHALTRYMSYLSFANPLFWGLIKASAMRSFRVALSDVKKLHKIFLKIVTNSVYNKVKLMYKYKKW